VLNGKVKRIVEISKDGDLLKEATDFNLNGNIIRAQLNGRWNCLVRHTYEYNTAGKPSALVVSNGFRDGQYKFGNNGRISMRSFDTKLYDLHGPVQKKFFTNMMHQVTLFRKMVMQVPNTSIPKSLNITTGIYWQKRVVSIAKAALNIKQPTPTYS
jgi:hypothetical protein